MITYEQIELALKENKTYKKAAKALGISTSHCFYLARSFGLASSNLKKEKLADLSVLLEDSPTAHYWIGFLLADGSFSKKTGRISVSIAEKDVDHLHKFCKFIHFKGQLGTKNPTISKIGDNYIHSGQQFYIESNNIKIVRLLMEKYDIENKKTYYPPRIDIIKNLLDLPMIVGFIDGDGSISINKARRAKITIRNYKTWIEFHRLIFEKLENTSAFPKEEGHFCTSYISDTRNINLLHSVAQEVNALDRKWNCIDPLRRPKDEIVKEKQNLVIKLSKEGLSIKEISEETGLSKSWIFKLKQRYVDPEEIA